MLGSSRKLYPSGTPFPALSREEGNAGKLRPCESTASSNSPAGGCGMALNASSSWCLKTVSVVFACKGGFADAVKSEVSGWRGHPGLPGS